MFLDFQLDFQKEIQHPTGTSCFVHRRKQVKNSGEPHPKHGPGAPVENPQFPDCWKKNRALDVFGGCPHPNPAHPIQLDQ